MKRLISIRRKRSITIFSVAQSFRHGGAQWTSRGEQSQLLFQYLSAGTENAEGIVSIHDILVLSHCTLVSYFYAISVAFPVRISHFVSPFTSLSDALELLFSIRTFSPLFRHFSLQGQFPGSDMNNRLSTLNLSNGAGGDHLSTNGAGFPSTLNNAIPRSNSLDASSPTTNSQVRILSQFCGSYRFSCCSCLSTLLSSWVKQSLRDSLLSIGINDVMF